MISAFDHPFLGGLLGDHEMAALLGIEAELKAMTRFEIELAGAEADAGTISQDAAAGIASALANFQPDMNALRQATAKDGVVVPELVRQMRKAVGEPHGDKLHVGATSQDVIDTALMLRLGPALDLIGQRIDALTAALGEIAQRCGRDRLMAVTRMQPAIPITAGDRIESWRAPLLRHAAKLPELARRVLAIQFGGAAGTLDKLDDKGEAVRANLASRLGLANAPQWQNQRDRIAELAGFLSMLTGSLGKFGQDLALLALAGDEIEIACGGASSAMPHKQNPVAAETLVTLARFNAVQLSGIHQSLVHENERSGTAWTLEWLILPQMVMAAGAGTKTALRLCHDIRRLGIAR